MFNTQTQTCIQKKNDNKYDNQINNYFLTSALYINNYNNNNIILLEPVKNSIIERSKFIKIIYSDQNIVMNGICVYLSFKDITYIFDSNSLNNNYRYKIFIDKNKNKDIINFIKNIEYDIFNKLSNNKKYENKKFNYKLSEQINTNFIKCTNDIENFNKSIERNNKFILKISGICETEYEYNITYKFIEINNNDILL
jgi:hypothetical protein